MFVTPVGTLAITGIDRTLRLVRDGRDVKFLSV